MKNSISKKFRKSKEGLNQRIRVRAKVKKVLIRNRRKT